MARAGLLVEVGRREEVLRQPLATVPFMLDMMAEAVAVMLAHILLEEVQDQEQLVRLRVVTTLVRVVLGSVVLVTQPI